MRKEGCKEIMLKSTITAKDFYEKNGYKIIKKTMHKIGDKKLQIYVMSKKLN